MAVWGAFLQPNSPSSTASALAMLLNPQLPTESINLATPGFLLLTGTPNGGRSATLAALNRAKVGAG